jgi:AraC-like DNA-binding protein
MKGVEIADRDLPRLAGPSGLSPIGRVVGISGSEPTGYYDPPHTHDRAQFSYRIRGFASIKAGARSIMLPPGYGVWIPAGIVHEVACRGPAAYQGLYAAPDVTPQPADVRVIRITPLLRVLMDSFVGRRPDEHADERTELILRLILEEIARAPDVSADAPAMPGSTRLRAICESLRSAPDNADGIDAWASRAGMSRRSFTRSFRIETGMSFLEWRHKVRMLRAIAWLEDGLGLHEIASRLGYASMSSFNRAFPALQPRGNEPNVAL